MLCRDGVLTCSLALLLVGCSPVGGAPINAGGGTTTRGATSSGSGSGAAGESGGSPVGGINLSAGGAVAGGSGAGGAGGEASGSLPSQEENCGSQTENTNHQLVDMLLVLDRSLSMLFNISEDCFCDQATRRNMGSMFPLCKDAAACSTRWSNVSSALKTTIPSTPFVRWGLKFFATPGQGECGVDAAVEVPVGEGNVDAINAKIIGTTPGNHTPTAAGIKAATAYLKSLAGDNPKVILLATDGVPNCAENESDQSAEDPEGTKAAIDAAFQAGIPTYVIGIGPSAGNLDDFATAGHTGKHYPATSPQALQEALNTIGVAVISCTFALSDPNPDAGAVDPNSVAVYVDKNLVEKDDTNGWSYGGDPKTIVLNGSTCEKVKTAKAATVQVLLGCKAPPAWIP